MNVTFPELDARRHRHPGKSVETFQRGRIEGERDETRARFDQVEAELLGDAVGEPGRPHFRDGRPARGNNKSVRRNRTLVRVDLKSLSLFRDL